MAEYLVLLFYELGICEQGANGVVAVSWKEIEAWMSSTDRQLERWEVQMLKDMSKAYVNEYYEARNKLRPEPFTKIEMTAEKRKNVQSAFRAQMEAIKNSRK